MLTWPAKSALYEAISASLFIRELIALVPVPGRKACRWSTAEEFAALDPKKFSEMKRNDKSRAIVITFNNTFYVMKTRLKNRIKVGPLC